MVKERIASLDALKFFAIFLVIWGHYIQYFQSVIHYNQPIFRIIYSFHMPLFMALVGFFSASLSNLSLKRIITKKFYQLLLPSITVGTIIYCIIGDFNIETIKSLFFNNMWFLKSAFSCCIIYYSFYKIASERSTPYLIFVSLIISH